MSAVSYLPVNCGVCPSCAGPIPIGGLVLLDTSNARSAGNTLAICRQCFDRVSGMNDRSQRNWYRAVTKNRSRPLPYRAVLYAELRA